MSSYDLPYEADGLAMNGKLFLPDDLSSPKPGILVFPEVFGLGDHAIDRARRLADLGYVALACDLHGDRKIISDMNEVMGIAGHLREDSLRIRKRTDPALAALVARPEVDATRIGAIGFCFGGTMALELARGGANVAAVVGFHSGLATTRKEDASQIQGRVLVCLGADDPSIAVPARAEFEEEMRAGGVRAQMMLYGGVVHSFTNPHADKMGRPEFARYDAEADRHSWMLMQDAFREAFA
jgi:dienelactone hydrolase